MIKAVTFDLWDTIVYNDTDETKRAAQGLRSKKEERRHLLWAALNGQEPIERDRVWLAYDVADAPSTGSGTTSMSPGPSRSGSRSRSPA